MEPATTELWQSLGVALAIGLLIGAERERDHQSRTAGIRTFALVAVTGSISVQVPVVVAAVLCGGVGLLAVSAYLRGVDADPGYTTEVAVLATLGLGALSREAPSAAVGLAVAVTVLLVSRENLHHFVRETITDQERADALVFFVAAFVVLPILPSGAVGPYGAWVPQRIWLLVVMIIAISWVGYAATRLLGASRGLMIGGLAGGFVSATATTGVMGARVRNDGVPLRAGLAGALLASVATLVQLAVLTSIVDVRVTVRLLPACVAGGLVLGLEAWWLGRRSANPDADTSSAGRPFALVPALVLAGIISAVLPVALWMQDRYGANGAVAASATAALADVHGASVAMATLVHSGDIGLATAVTPIGAGLATNTIGKLVAGTVGGGFRFAGALLVCLLPVAVVVGTALVLT
jgi:uncharacterized membrane protein (DUF4010 family)